MPDIHTRPPEIDYLAKDFASFRRLLLDQLALQVPDWQERSAADLGHVLVEILAYAADYLAYYQDAVATEAYLGTARRRHSIRRHTRLLDYRLHEGCNARAWVHIKVSGDTHLEKRTPVLTGREAAADGDADGLEAQAFETMHDIELYVAHNLMRFHVPEGAPRVLRRGSTSVHLERSGPSGSQIRLAPGDVLILEEIRDPKTGQTTGADPRRTHAVRLTDVSVAAAPAAVNGGGGTVPEHAALKVTWAAADALPFDLFIAPLVRGTEALPVSVALGNVVLVDHGRTIAGEALASVPRQGRYRPYLRHSNMTHRVPYDHQAALKMPASATIVQDPREALAAIDLASTPMGISRATPWTLRHELLNSTQFDRSFVVETEDTGRAYLRFGFGRIGRQPTPYDRFMATYRVGNGSQGNVGPNAITRVVTDDPRITHARNPLPVQSGINPEAIEEARTYSPHAFRTQLRCVTEEDYAAMATRHPAVVQAAAQVRWTGSWQTAIISVQRDGNLPVDEAFRREVRAFMEQFRITGYDIEIQGPRLVSLDIGLRVFAGPTGYRARIIQALRDVLGNEVQSNGERGFFHPANFAFGQSVYQSQLIAAVMAIPDVIRVEVTRFARLGSQDDGERIAIGPREIARLDNDPRHPERGLLQFVLEGGL